MTTSITQLLVFLFLGLLIGLITDYLAMTIPFNRIFKGPVCIDCENDYSFKDYLFFNKCPTCSKSTNFSRFIIIGIYVILSFVLWRRDTPPDFFYLEVVLLAYLGIVCIIDIRYQAIYLGTNIIGMALSITAGSLIFGIKSSLVGGITGSVLFLLLYLFAIVVRKIKDSKNKSITNDDEQDLGIGDILFAGVLGFLVGWPNIFTMISITMVISGLFGIVYQVTKKKKFGAKEVYFPFAPFMIGGTLITLFIVM